MYQYPKQSLTINKVIYTKSLNMREMGVNSCDSWIDEDTPYILLSEEVEQEYYVSEYWTDELKKKYEVVETIREIDDLIKFEIFGIQYLPIRQTKPFLL